MVLSANGNMYRYTWGCQEEGSMYEAPAFPLCFCRHCSLFQCKIDMNECNKILKINLNRQVGQTVIAVSSISIAEYLCPFRLARQYYCTIKTNYPTREKNYCTKMCCLGLVILLWVLMSNALCHEMVELTKILLPSLMTRYLVISYLSHWRHDEYSCHIKGIG